MSKANLGWLFYKEMYKLGDSEEQIEHVLNKMLKIRAFDETLNAKENFRLQTLYPGLLIGSGYTHGLSLTTDVKIGFYFDHTTGLPLIQGSSVKGMLRSCFGLEFENQEDIYKIEKHKLIRHLLNKPNLDVEAFARDIFEGIDPETLKIKSIYERDIFYEARVIELKDDTVLLSEDNITPHGDNPCIEPKPLKFIKVSPEVTFEFSFDLKDSKFANAQEKKELFLTLLEEFGIGAKTNVGYGQLELILTKEEKERKEEEKRLRDKENKAKAKEEENKGLSKLEIFLKKLEKFTKQDKDMLKHIKEYDINIEDIDTIKELIESKIYNEKFNKKIMNYLNKL